jgi:hypothetical protein
MLCLTYDGRIQTIKEWADERGIHRNLIYKRMGEGITDPAELLKINHRRKKLRRTIRKNYVEPEQPQVESSPTSQISRLEADRRIISLVAKSGGRRPSRRSSDPEERRLAWTISRHQKQKDIIYEELCLARPDWFDNPVIGIVADTKQQLLDLAKSGSHRPNRDSLDKAERKLAEALRRYTRKDGESYDSDFDEEIRRVRPDWFGRGRKTNYNNILPVHYGATYTCNGETLTVAGWAKKLGYDQSGIRWRLRHHPPEIALAASKKEVTRASAKSYSGGYNATFTHNGETLAAPEWAKKLGYAVSTMYQRLREKPLEIALTPFVKTHAKTARKAIRDQQVLDQAEKFAQELRVSTEPVSAEPIATKPIATKPIDDAPKIRRRKPNPVRVSSKAVEQMRECIGRKDVIYGDDKAIRERLRKYLLKSIEVEMPRCLVTDDQSPTARYFRHNNWILTIDGGLYITMITYGGAKQWRVKRQEHV